jgi:hypothetical protein
MSGLGRIDFTFKMVNIIIECRVNGVPGVADFEITLTIKAQELLPRSPAGCAEDPHAVQPTLW